MVSCMLLIVAGCYGAHSMVIRLIGCAFCFEICQTQRKALSVLTTFAFLYAMGSSLGLLCLLRLRRVATFMPRAVDATLTHAFGKICPGMPQENPGKIFLDDFWHFFRSQHEDGFWNILESLVIFGPFKCQVVYRRGRFHTCF